jgi:DNA (cytosine-5)-methyltransferase 1
MDVITHVDLFSGAGGIATGFQAAGIRTVAAVEYVDSCVETYRANHPHTPVIHKDVREVSISDFKSLGIETVDLVTAGMPCETFSTAGKSSRSFYDKRQVLYKDGIRIALELKAPTIIFENVPALLTKRVSKESSSLIISKIKADLEKAGFKYVQQMVLNASEYGVPQSRDRLFIIASKLQIEFRMPEKSGERITVAQAFADLPLVQPNSKSSTKSFGYLSKSNNFTEKMKDLDFWKTRTSFLPYITFHESPNHREETLIRYSLISQGEGLKDLFKKFEGKELTELQSRRILPKKIYGQRNRRLKSNIPAPTVTSHCLDEFIHPTLDRGLTIREVARLQSFPDWYNIAGGPNVGPHNDFQQDKYEQLGDSVPPLLAFAVAEGYKQAVNITNREMTSESVA